MGRSFILFVSLQHDFFSPHNLVWCFICACPQATLLCGVVQDGLTSGTALTASRALFHQPTQYVFTLGYVLFCPATLLCLLSFCLLFLTLLGMPFALYALLHFPAFLSSRFWFLPLKPRESFFILFSDALNLPSSSLPLGCCYRFWRSPSSFPFRIFRNVSADRVETRMQICRYLQ